MAEETGPPDPISNLREAAAMFHELFSEFVKVGFTEAQALELVKAQITGMAGGKA